MPRRSFKYLPAVVATCCLFAYCLAARAAEENQIRIEDHRQPGDHARTFFDGQRPIFRYRYAEVPFKPYVDQLFSPAGVQVLRDAPKDHLHHHALMFAVAVDGINFWEEHSPKAGKQRHRSWGDCVATTLDGADGKIVRISQSERLDWTGPDPDRPLLVENRQLTAYRADLGATLVEWRSRLETPPGKDAITLSGSPYFGLGARFVESMDSGGRFFDSDGRQGEALEGGRRLTPAKWCAYSAKAGGRPVTFALFDHPDNPRHPARMYTMTDPFAYLSATMGLKAEPLELKAGEPLELCYAAALWDGETDRATVERLYGRWLKLNEDGRK